MHPPRTEHPRTETTETARLSAARLTAEGVTALATTFVDTAGITRAKTVPTARLVDTAVHGIGISPVFDSCLVDDSMTTTGRHISGPDGDLRLFPDLDRLTTPAPAPGWAWAPADRYQQDGTPHPGCQRLFARRTAERAEHHHGLTLRMGFETEWTLTTPGPDTPDGTPPHHPCHGPAYGAARIAELPDYLTALLDTLRAQGVAVLQLHPEYAPGQFEISTAPEDPVAAADTAVLVRETVRAVTLAHGMRPCFAPTVHPDRVGNGRHLHLSLWRGDTNLCAGDDPAATPGPGPLGMAREAESFLAGILTELPALLAVGVPSPAGYLRLTPSRWAGAYQCWGHETREAALRVITTPTNPAAANAEIKCFDPAANPYLLVGAVIGAGLAGIDAGLRLPDPITGDPAHHPGTAPRLPDSLPHATERFAHSTVLHDALGDVLHDTVLAVRRAEAELFATTPPDELAAATRWRY